VQRVAELYALALAIARIPEQIKGFGHIKERNLKLALANWDRQMAQLRSPLAVQRVA
jgi:indolepyruvate ferredoxin oxidoreductase